MFIDMGEFIGRTPEQCKSKMQKFERFAYIHFLNVPENHYDLFECLHKKRCKRLSAQRKKKSCKNLNTRKDDYFDFERKKVIEDIQSGRVKFKGR